MIKRPKRKNGKDHENPVSTQSKHGEQWWSQEPGGDNIEANAMAGLKLRISLADRIILESNLLMSNSRFGEAAKRMVADPLTRNSRAPILCLAESLSNKEEICPQLNWVLSQDCRF